MYALRVIPHFRYSQETEHHINQAPSATVPRGQTSNQLLETHSITFDLHRSAYDPTQPDHQPSSEPTKMAPLLPTSLASSSKPGRAGSMYSFEDSYSRARGGNGVEAYTLPKSERGLPLVLRRLGKFKSMVRLSGLLLLYFQVWAWVHERIRC